MSTLKKALKARELSSFLFLIVLFIIVSLINPTFASSDNISACFNSAVVYILIAVGMAFAIIVGEIDVSVGSNLGFVATVVGSLLRTGWWHLPWASSSAPWLASSTAGAWPSWVCPRSSSRWA